MRRRKRCGTDTMAAPATATIQTLRVPTISLKEAETTQSGTSYSGTEAYPLLNPWQSLFLQQCATSAKLEKLKPSKNTNLKKQSSAKKLTLPKLVLKARLTLWLKVMVVVLEEPKGWLKAALAPRWWFSVLPKKLTLHKALRAVAHRKSPGGLIQYLKSRVILA